MATQHVTTTVNGVPKTTTVSTKKTTPGTSLPAVATTGVAGTLPASQGLAKASGGVKDAIRAPGDTRYTNEFGQDQNYQDANAAAPQGPPTTPQEGVQNAPVTPGMTGPQMPVSAIQPLSAPVQTAAASPTPTQNKYQQGLAAAQATGAPAPTDAGDARTAVAAYTPPSPADTTGVDQFLSQDPAINTLMSGITQLLNPKNQTTTLMQDYAKLRKSSGLDKINAEIIDADTVINGTEDDIRNEIQTAGGMGTESQVQAMTLARNKNLLTRYNQLVQMKTDATNQLNTMMSLNQQDKQMAQEKINSQVSAMFNMANFRQTALQNTRSQYQWMSEQMGADGLYNSLSNDPRQLAFAEQILGTGQGGLQKLATQAAAKRAKQDQMDNLDIAAKQASINASNRRQTEVVDVGGAKYLIDSQTGKTISTIGAGGQNTTDLSTAQANIQQINDLLKVPYTANAAGANGLARVNLANVVTGAKSNFIAGVQQVQQQLTLNALQNAKANGATFGALSEGELNLLAQSSSKIGTWTVKDSSGNVKGYNTTPQALQQELSKINNLAKLDYVKKGGSPMDVGVLPHADGTYWTQNADGTYTKLY